MAKDDGELRQIGLRGSRRLHRRLQVEADRNGYSLNAQIVRLLEASLRADDLGEVVFGDREAYAWADRFVRLLHAAAMRTGKDWRDDRATALQAIDVLRRFIEVGPEAVADHAPAGRT